MVGIAATGSGKTMAFGLPARSCRSSRSPSVRRARRSASCSRPPASWRKTAKVFEDAGTACGVRCVCVYGGAPKWEQKKLMQQGGWCAVIVATPGRLRDFMNDGDVKLDKVTMLVLDEADRMLDLGFEPGKSGRSPARPARGPPDRHVLRHVAHVHPRLGCEFMCNPVKVRIGAEGLKAVLRGRRWWRSWSPTKRTLTSLGS